MATLSQNLGGVEGMALGSACFERVGRAVALTIGAWGIGSVSAGGHWWQLGLMVVLPLLWGASGSRRAAWAVATAYYLAITRGLPAGAGVFFGGAAADVALGYGCWLLDALLLGGVWALLWGRRARAWRAMAAVIILAVPPLGVLGWGSPLLGAGVWFPGLGLAGAAAMLGLIGAAAGLMGGSRVAGATAALLAGSALVANVAYRRPASPAGWVGMNTHLGLLANSFMAHDRRQEVLVRLARRQLAAGARVVVFPESVAGTWTPAVAAQWRPVGALGYKRGRSVLVGAYYWVGGWDAGFAELGAHASALLSRQPIPISEYKPWDPAHSVHAHWWRPGIGHADGRRFGYLVCYEEVLVWPALLTAAHHPQVLVGVANDWWARGTHLPTLQHASAQAWARLIGVPLVSAVNL